MRILTPLLVSPPFDLQFGSFLSGYYMPFARYYDTNAVQRLYDNAMQRQIEPNQTTRIIDNQPSRLFDPNGPNTFRG